MVYSECQDDGSVLRNNIVHDSAFGELSRPTPSPQTSPMAWCLVFIFKKHSLYGMTRYPT